MIEQMFNQAQCAVPAECSTATRAVSVMKKHEPSDCEFDHEPCFDDEIEPADCDFNLSSFFEIVPFDDSLREATGDDKILLKSMGTDTACSTAQEEA